MKKFLLLAITLVLTVALAGPANALSSSQTKKFDADIIKYSNTERTKYKKAKFATNSCLDKYAQAQANRMAKSNKMYHQSLSPVLKACKMRTVGENVAYGFTSGKANVAAWMKSPGHRKNLLNGSFKKIGVGVATGKGGRVFTAQVFGG